MSRTARIWEAHATGRRVGAYDELRPDLVYGHEGTIGLILDALRAAPSALPPERLFFVVDHFSPPSSGPFADIVRDFRMFCRERGIALALHDGIGHRLMLESDRVAADALVLGADSHTTTIGGKGALGIGLGSTDIQAVMTAGTVWLRRPVVSHVRLQGRWPDRVEAKDVVLSLLGRHGQDGFLGHVVEFADATRPGLDREARAVITNMTVEMGAVSGIFADGDDATEAPGWQVATRPDVDVAALVPLVALPGTPDKVVPAADLADVAVDTAVVGSCASGGIRDLEVAASLAKGRRVAPGTTLLVTPSTRSVYREAMRRGYLETLVAAGAVILNPSCGVCGGIDKGIPAQGDTMISTAPRNYGSRARVGSRVFLASTATVVASSLAGAIRDPRLEGDA